MTSGGVAWLGFKWLVAPVLVYGVGYYLVGPRIGESAVLEEKAQAVTQAVGNTILDSKSEPEESEQTKSKFGKMDINVSVSTDKDGEYGFERD